MEELSGFRTETRAWLEANCPASMRQPMTSDADLCWGGRNATFTSEDQKLWLERMSQRGWTVPDWPVEYGGGGLTPAQSRILREEMAELTCRPPLKSFGVSMLGPALLRYGTEAQKREHLPKIARGEIRWCQGYSEPGAGSDLAGLQTRAIEDGTDYIVNGQKVWTSHADKSDWIFCLVRTDTSVKQGGITFLLFDMTTPGVSTRPIQLISGYSPFCETFFDNVRVPRSQVVGEVDKGWEVAKFLLGHEREMISGMGLVGSGEAALIESALATWGEDDTGRLANPILRARIVSFEVRAEAFRAMTERFIDEHKAGTSHPAQSSMMKYFGTELNKLRNELAVAAGGSLALEWDSSRSSNGAVPRAWLRSKGNSIEGGTSEIQLNIIAKRILELPGS